MSLDNHPATRKCVFEYLRSLNCARALTCWLLFENGEHDQLAELDFDIRQYLDTDIAWVRDSYAASKLLSKFPYLRTTFNRGERAMGTFFAAEEQCLETNRRLTDWRNEPPVATTIISVARRKIEHILSDFSYDEFVDSCNWGPGASVAIKRRDASAPNKYLIESGITVQAYDFVAPFIADQAFRFSDRPFCFERGNKVVTVPKNAKTDRVIAIEPGLNLWHQKGIGSMIRRRLQRVGIDLNRGQDHHSRLAKLASKTGHLATVDFSSASDTIAYKLVEILLPERWFHLLKAFRSSCGLVDGKYVPYDKFSSMGNGYTFELETLIFFSLASACADYCGAKGEISVYGDDVILPSSSYTLYSEICTYCGFTVNLSKSFSTGWFRESCGAHFFKGQCVKPIFLKEDLNGTEALFKFANSVRRVAHRRSTYGCDRALRRCWLTIVGFISRPHRQLTISDGFGDGGLVVNYEEASPCVTRAPNQFEGFFAKCRAAIPQMREEQHRGVLSHKLRITGELATGNLVAYPGRVRSRTIKLLIPRWYDLGPWI